MNINFSYQDAQLPQRKHELMVIMLFKFIQGHRFWY